MALCIPSASVRPNQSAQNFHVLLASCTDSIGEACRAVEAFLKEQPPEVALGFFRLCFSLLLQKVFGFQESASSSSSAWLTRATDEQSTSALRSLLHPSGHLFSSLLVLDREKAVQFIFPNERLPLRIRRLLLLDRGVTLLSQTSELFKNRMKISNVGGLELQLDLFEYYVFWFAYYAASCEEYGPTQSVLAMKLSRSSPSPSRSFSHWVPVLHPISNHHGTKSTTSHDGIYLQLLQLYLTQFVQLHHYAGMVYIPGTHCLSQGGFLLLTLLEFWLMKDDSWPLQDSQLGTISTGFTHSSVELNAVRVIINHYNRLLKASFNAHYGSYDDGNLVATGRVLGSHSFMGSSLLFTPTLQMSGGRDIPNIQILQKPLYRFISRAFHYWPAGIPVKQAWHLVQLWVDYMQPWSTDVDKKSAVNVCDTSKYAAREFSAVWQGYVTRNHRFYTVLVVHYLNFALKYVCSNLEPILEMTAKVLGTLIGSKDLLELLRKIELNTYSVSGMMDMEHALFADMDWEDSALSSENMLRHEFSPSTQHEAVQKSRLFVPGEGGAFHTFQMLVLQCEAEIQFLSPESQKLMSKSLEYVKHAGLEIFHSHFLSSLTGKIQPENQAMTSLRDEARALGRHTCFDVKYRGDWMKRPIESTEVAFLARLLVNLSETINYRLNLDGQAVIQGARIPCGKGSPKFEELNVAELLRTSRQSVVTLSIFDLVKEIKAFLLSCGAAMCDQLRRRGMRVNLRFLAQKPVVVLVVVVLTWLLRKLYMQVLSLYFREIAGG